MAVTLAIFAGLSPARAADPVEPHPRLFRFEFDNDTFMDSDDAFSAGWSLQLHSAATDTWSGPIGRTLAHLPGLGDDGSGGRVVRRALVVTQSIFTPNDITIAEPQPDDVPWAGILAMAASWSSFDDRRLGALQVTVGCLGPCSGAEDVQKFVHEDLNRGDPPRGWHNQLEQQWVANVVYGRAWKILPTPKAARGAGRAWSQDLAGGFEAGLGNLATFADAFVGWRFGWNVPRGFTNLPDPAGIGIAVDPVLPQATSAGRWRLYGTLTARTTYMAHHVVAEGGATESGPDHPGVEYVRPQFEVIAGVHVAYRRVELSVTHYRYFGEEPLLGVGVSPDWVALALDVRY